MTKKLARLAERGSIIDQAAVDYLTCSTYNGDQYLLAVDIINAINKDKDKPEPKTARGYETISYGWGSHGEGWQKGNPYRLGGEPHFLINVNGKEADQVLKSMLEKEGFNRELWNFSRIDIQLTVKRDRETSLGMLQLQLEDGQLGEFSGRGKPNTRAITSKTGHTLYIGSPKSQKMIRFYDKPLVHKRYRTDFERYEIQFRDDYANPLVTKLFRQAPYYNRNILWNTLKAQYKLLPPGLQEALSFRNSFTEVVSADAKLETTDKTDSNKIKWLQSLTRALTGLASKTGTDGQKARETLLGVLVVGCTGDSVVNWQEYKLLSPDGKVIDPLQLSQD